MANETKSAPIGKAIIGPLRASYAHLMVPQRMSDGSGEPKYSVSLIIPKSDTATLKIVQDAIDRAYADGVSNKWKNKKPANWKNPLRDGDKDRPDNPEYADSMFITASSKTKPGLVDRKNQPIVDETEIYSGMFVKASVNFYAFDAKGSKGVACGLNHIQKVKDGEPLGGRGRAEDDFEPLEDDGDSDILD